MALDEKRIDDLLKQYATGDGKLTREKVAAQEAAEFCKPRKANINTGPKAKGTKNPKRFSSYAEADMDIWASGTQSTTMPRDGMWFNFSLENEKSAEVKEHKEWLQHLDQVVLSALLGSNLTDEVHDGIVDGGYAGRCNIFMKEGAKQVLYFETRPPFEYVFYGDKDGNPDTGLAKVTRTAREWDKEFDGKGGEVIAQHMKDKEYDKDVEFLHAVFPRDKRNPDIPGALNMPFAEVFVEISKKETVHESGFSRFPFLAFGIIKPISCPAQKAMGEIKQLNTIDKTTLRGGQKIVDPPLAAQNNAVTGPIRNGVSSVTFMDFINGDKPPVQAMPTGNPGFGIELSERKQHIIDQHFCRAAFEMEEVRSGVTLGERQMRKMEKAMVMEPFFSRFFKRIPEPMLMMAFDICMRKGLVRNPPESMGGDKLKVVLTGPLVRAMRYGADVEATDEMYGRAKGIYDATQDMSVFDNLDNDAAMKIYDKRFNPPAQLVRSDKEKQELRQERAEAQQKQEQMEQAAMGADMAAKLGQGVQGNA